MISRQERASGTIKFFDHQRGYGFVQTADEHELFMHVTDFVSDDEPHEGDRVSFVERTGRDGKPRAISVMPAAI